ncbi:MAG: ATP-binding cassette domain-containing protein [Deltaproteobacteria bacterium]|nr:ATP-binding cassette domain-containing protein [Deltaproteobacteria bacterium]MCW5801690.1 ATP-binding cassette domain-containing protein [Deltaproteobacteria bacterium]
MSGPVIATRDLAIGWSPSELLLEHASFQVERGEVFGILGRSAAGKSTLLRVLIGLESPIAGDLDVLGERPQATIASHKRPSFGVMYQHGALFGALTVGQNVGLPLEVWTDLPADAVRAIARAKLALVGLGDTVDQSPATLSGGMRKRAAIARALALEPPLLFLDEPCSGLDPVTSAEIDHLIATLAHAYGLTIVLVTHERSTIQTIVDRCIVLDRGERRIVAGGVPAELAQHPIPEVRAFFVPAGPLEGE